MYKEFVEQLPCKCGPWRSQCSFWSLQRGLQGGHFCAGTIFWPEHRSRNLAGDPMAGQQNRKAGSFSNLGDGLWWNQVVLCLFFVINTDLSNPLAEFWLLTLAHKSVFKMNTHIADCTKGGSTERSQGSCLNKKWDWYIYLALPNKKHKRKSGKDRSKELDLRADKNLSTQSQVLPFLLGRMFFLCAVPLSLKRHRGNGALWTWCKKQDPQAERVLFRLYLELTSFCKSY